MMPMIWCQKRAYPIASIRREHVMAYRDVLSEKAATCNAAMRTLRLLFNWAIDRGILAHNPALRTKRLRTGERQPWPDGALATFRENGPPELVWAVELALHTGQRRGDVLTMRWNDISEGLIRVVQEKPETKREMWIPIHPKLAAILETLPRRAVTILTTKSGRVWTKGHFNVKFHAAKKAIGLGEYVFHGLRKNAARNLAEAGCSTEQIKAITGHETDAMVSHYVKGANQKRLATAAIAKLVRDEK